MLPISTTAARCAAWSTKLLPAGFAALAGVDPFLVVPGRSIQYLRRLADRSGLGFRQQRRAEQQAVVADDQRAVVGKDVVGSHFLRQRRHHAAVVPLDNDLGPIVLGGETIGHDRCQRCRLVLDFGRCVPVGRARFHALGPAELQGLERRRQVMATDVAQDARCRNPTSRARRTDGSRDDRVASATGPIQRSQFM